MESKNPKNGYFWLGRIFLRHPLQSIFTFVIPGLEALLFTVPIGITARVIDGVFQGGSLASVKSDLWIFLGVALFQAILYFTLSFINEVLAHRITTDMTQDLFEELQFRSLTYHDSQDVGDIMARATGDTRTVNIAISPGIRIFVSIAAIWGLNIFMAWRVHYILGLSGIAVFLLYVYTSIKYATKLEPLSQKVRERFSEVSEETSNSIAGITEMKGFAAQKYLSKKFKLKTVKLKKQEIREGKVAAWFYPQLTVTLYSSLLVVLTILFYSQDFGDVSLEEVIAISGYILLLIGISEELDWTMNFLVRANACMKRLYSIIFDSDPGKFQEGTLDFAEYPATIEFRNVDFRYDENLPLVLKNISFKIEENQTIAIVGGPGSGKSTLTKLVQRLYLPTAGEVLLGGKSIQNFTNESLRKRISTIEQDIFLFNTSVRSNIKFGKPDSSIDEVIKFAKLAEAHEFIMEMPEKYENLIGEGGVRLSGGQAQRISIARALLMAPSILIMDDGASALDAKTEIKIQNAISNILKNHTTLITTHRLAIISKADHVIILDHGKMVGIGTHESLIRTNIYYRKLFERHYELPALKRGPYPVAGGEI